MFDVPERMFYSIQKEWESASKDNMSDVRELIPEFFYLPDFLVNSNNFDFGETSAQHCHHSFFKMPLLYYFISINYNYLTILIQFYEPIKYVLMTQVACKTGRL